MRTIRTVDGITSRGVARIRVFHDCGSFHTGRVIGQGVIASWWAERGLDGWVYLWESDNPHLTDELEVLINAAVGRSPSDRLRLLQDAAAESPV